MQTGSLATFEKYYAPSNPNRISLACLILNQLRRVKQYFFTLQHEFSTILHDHFASHLTFYNFANTQHFAVNSSPADGSDR